MPIDNRKLLSENGEISWEKGQNTGRMEGDTVIIGKKGLKGFGLVTTW